MSNLYFFVHTKRRAHTPVGMNRRKWCAPSDGRAPKDITLRSPIWSCQWIKISYFQCDFSSSDKHMVKLCERFGWIACPSLILCIYKAFYEIALAPYYSITTVYYFQQMVALIIAWLIMADHATCVPSRSPDYSHLPHTQLCSLETS